MGCEGRQNQLKCKVWYPGTVERWRLLVPDAETNNLYQSAASIRTTTHSNSRFRHSRLNYFYEAVFTDKITGSQLVKKFPAFYGTRKFIIAFTTHHPSLS